MIPKDKTKKQKLALKLNRRSFDVRVRKYGSNLKKKVPKSNVNRIIIKKTKKEKEKRKNTLGEKCKMSKSKEGSLVVVLRRGAGRRGDAVRWLQLPLSLIAARELLSRVT